MYFFFWNSEGMERLNSSIRADFSISLEMNPKNNDIDEILQLPEKIAWKKGYNIVVCIDEFQQRAEFKDSNTFQKRLRSIWQLQKSVSYCLSGSKKHLMNELFEKKSLPFYKFGDAIYLQKIGTPDWIDYICGRFEATGKHISKELAEKICLKVDNHSSYVQQLAWLVWIHTDKIATEQDFEAGCHKWNSYRVHHTRDSAGIPTRFVRQCQYRKTRTDKERTYRN